MFILTRQLKYITSCIQLDIKLNVTKTASYNATTMALCHSTNTQLTVCKWKTDATQHYSRYAYMFNMTVLLTIHYDVHCNWSSSVIIHPVKITQNNAWEISLAHRQIRDEPIIVCILGHKNCIYISSVLNYSAENYFTYLWFFTFRFEKLFTFRICRKVSV